MSLVHLTVGEVPWVLAGWCSARCSSWSFSGDRVTQVDLCWSAAGVLIQCFCCSGDATVIAAWKRLFIEKEIT